MVSNNCWGTKEGDDDTRKKKMLTNHLLGYVPFLRGSSGGSAEVMRDTET